MSPVIGGFGGEEFACQILVPVQKCSGKKRIDRNLKKVTAFYSSSIPPFTCFRKFSEAIQICDSKMLREQALQALLSLYVESSKGVWVLDKTS